MTEPIESGWLSGTFRDWTELSSPHAHSHSSWHSGAGYTSDALLRRDHENKDASSDAATHDSETDNLDDSIEYKGTHSYASPTPHMVPVMYLRPTQWTVGIESTQRRAEFLKEMMTNQGPSSLLSYLKRKPISCVIGPNFPREAFLGTLSASSNHHSNEETLNNFITARMLFTEDSTGLKCEADEFSVEAKQSLYIVDRHHTCLALLLLQDDEHFKSFFSEIREKISNAQIRMLQQDNASTEDNRRAQVADMGIGGTVESIVSQLDSVSDFEFLKNPARVFVNILDDLSDCKSLEEFFNKLRERELIGTTDYECPIELQTSEEAILNRCFASANAAYSFTQMRSDPFKSLSWAARHRGYSEADRIGKLVSNNELTEGPGYSILHWRFWYAPSTWALYLRNRFLALSSKAQDLRDKLKFGQNVVPSNERQPNEQLYEADDRDYVCLGLLVTGPHARVLSPAFVKLARAINPPKVGISSSSLNKEAKDMLKRILMMSTDDSVEKGVIEQFLENPNSLSWALETLNTLADSHNLASTHVFDAATVDQACRFCWDLSEEYGANRLPGFLGYLVNQHRLIGFQMQKGDSLSTVIPGSRDFDKLLRSDDILESTWCKVDTLKPTQRCAGFAAVNEKCAGLEKHWRKGGRAALRKYLMKKAVPCVVAPIEATAEHRMKSFYSLFRKEVGSSNVQLYALQSEVLPSEETNENGRVWATQIYDDLEFNKPPTSELDIRSFIDDEGMKLTGSKSTVLFLVDHHHLSLALKTSNLIPEDEKFVYVSIALDLRALSASTVWKILKQKKLCYLPIRGEFVFPRTNCDEQGEVKVEEYYTSFEEGQQRELECMKKDEDTYTECWLPEQIVNLQDDPFRSIAWYVRNWPDSEGGPGFHKVNIEFFEFMWADYMRSHPLVQCILSLVAEEKVSRGEATFDELSENNHWRVLQGYEDNPTVIDFFVRLCRYPRAKGLAGFTQTSYAHQSVSFVKRTMDFFSNIFSSGKQPIFKGDGLNEDMIVKIRNVNLRDWDYSSIRIDVLEKLESALQYSAIRSLAVLISSGRSLHDALRSPL